MKFKTFSTITRITKYVFAIYMVSFACSGYAMWVYGPHGLAGKIFIGHGVATVAFMFYGMAMLATAISFIGAEEE